MNESLDELRALLEFERAARIEAERSSRLKDEFLEALNPTAVINQSVPVRRVYPKPKCVIVFEGSCHFLD